MIDPKAVMFLLVLSLFAAGPAPLELDAGVAVPVQKLNRLPLERKVDEKRVARVLGSLDLSPEEAAYTLGASQWVTFRRIVLPNIWPGIMYGIVLTLARALGEFGAVAVVGGGIEGQTETATMFINRALDDRNNAAAYSIALLLGLVAVAVLLIMRFLQRSLTREQQYHVDPTG